MTPSDNPGNRRIAANGHVPLLRNRIIRRGERWIYSAGFNVRLNLRETSRIDAELDDIRRISQSGGKVAILSHQGGYGDGTALHLDFIAGYLTQRLGQPVRYVPTSIGADAVASARSLQDGEVAIFGNTRHYEGEESNDVDLAKAFSELGDFVAIGGFSKAHRVHASNVGILKFLPGYLADSVSREMDFLAPWAGEDRSLFSVAVLGGQKREKTVVGLGGFSGIYDFVIPGGAVLNNVLKALGYSIGGSYLGRNPELTCKAAQRALAERRKAQIFIPRQIIVATKFGHGYRSAKTITLGERVDADEAIVDFVLDADAIAALTELVARQGRLLIAGTPSLYEEGFRACCRPLLNAANALNALNGRAILLGGDTVAELPFEGPRSVGGGSALQYLSSAALPIQTALAAQQAQAVRA